MLLNSNEWTDYKQEIKVFVKQSAVIMISRYVDENNFLGCTFSGKYIEIFQKINGETKVVASTIIESSPYTNFFYNELNLSMRVKGKTVGCSSIGEDDNVAFENVDNRLLKGGIGIQTWVNAPGIANVELKNVKTTSI
jgi:hypothetical protein